MGGFPISCLFFFVLMFWKKKEEVGEKRDGEGWGGALLYRKW